VALKGIRIYFRWFVKPLVVFTSLFRPSENLVKCLMYYLIIMVGFRDLRIDFTLPWSSLLKFRSFTSILRVLTSWEKHYAQTRALLFLKYTTACYASIPLDAVKEYMPSVFVLGCNSYSALTAKWRVDIFEIIGNGRDRTRSHWIVTMHAYCSNIESVNNQAVLWQLITVTPDMSSTVSCRA
jgi:hypothetical protein